MAELLPTDKFLVNRDDNTSTVPQAQLMAELLNTDHLLVNRTDTTFKITGQDLINSIIDPLDITVTLAPTTGYIGTPVVATAVVSGGKEPEGGYSIDYQWYLADDPSGLNATAIDGATNQSYLPVASDAGVYLGCSVSTADLFSNTATDTAYIGPVTSLNAAPVIDSVTLSETGDGSARFTSQTFGYDTVMSVDGKPAPQYSLKAKLSGSTFDFSTKSDTITDIDNITVPGGWNAVPAAESNNWYGLTYGGGKFVAVASTGTNRVMWSTDGINNWTSAAATEDNSWTSVTYGNNKFVAVSSNGTNRVMYSADAITWTAASATEPNNWQSVTYADNKFVAVSSSGANRVMYSADGISWTSASAGEDNGWSEVAYVGGKFVSVAYNGTNRVMYSDNGINWTAVAAAEDNSWRSVTYGNGKFVAVANTGTNRVMYSDDAITWTAVAVEDRGWFSVTYGDGKFVATSSQGSGPNIRDVMWSADGINWTSIATLGDRWAAVVYGDNKFVATSLSDTNGVMWSTTGTDEYEATELTCASDSGLADIDAAGGEVYMTDGSIEADGSFAKSSYTPTTSNIASVAEVVGYDLFTTTLYPGTGAEQTIDTGIDNTGKTLVWIKSTVGAYSHALAGNNLVNGSLSSNLTAGVDTSSNIVTDYSSNGFSIGNSGLVNDSQADYVAWNFRAAPQFMDIVTYDGESESGSTYFTVPHQLGSVPAMMIIKRLTAAEDWAVYHQSIPNANSNVIKLNDTGAAGTTNTASNWGFTDPTATEFTTNGDPMTGNLGDKYVAYLFADTPGLIKCGSYDGTGVSNKVTTGFKCAFVMVKSVDISANWIMRSPLDSPTAWNGQLKANLPDAESTSAITIDQTDGFTLTNGLNDINNSSSKYIYIAIAEDAGSPSETELTLTDATDLPYFQAGDKVEGLDTPATLALTPAFSTTLYEADAQNNRALLTGIDNTDKALVWIKGRSGVSQHNLFDTLRGPLFNLSTAAPDQQYETPGTLTSFNSDGVTLGPSGVPNANPGDQMVAWNFRAAPGFMDIVTFKGTGATFPSVHSVPHSLGSEPGFIITKRTSGSSQWVIYHKEMGEDCIGYFTTSKFDCGDGYKCYGDINDKTFGVMATGDTNNSDFVAYLFADTPGTIKCGSGSGMGQVDVGFEPQWLLFKTTNTAVSWSIIDNKRFGNVAPSYQDTLYANASNAEDSIGIYLNSTGFDNQTYSDDFIYVAIAEGATAGDFLPTGIVTEADPDGPTLTINNTTGDWTAQTGLPVSGPTNTAEGTWDSYAGNDATLSAVTGRWISTNGAGTNFSITPKDPIVTTVTEVYGNLQIIGDKARVTGIQADDPGFMNVTAQDYTIEFPATFATGNPPDTDLPAGTALSAIVKAENNLGNSTVESNAVIPALPFYSALDSNNPAHVEMSQDIAAAFEAFPKNVQARKQQIAKSFAKLVAGATITKKEIEALRRVVMATAEEEG